MIETTKGRLIAAASDLLDAGGQAAITLRAVAEAVGVSHNAPYRHFRDRSVQDAGTSLRSAAMALVVYGRAHPARYRLLFSDPDLPSAGGTMEVAAMGAFHAFGAIVRRCQSGGGLPPVETARLTGLIYATLHGAIDLELGGRARQEKGLSSVEATVALLFDLLARPAAP